MSIEHCDKHDIFYDTDFVENCGRCEDLEIQMEEELEQANLNAHYDETVKRVNNELTEDEAIERDHDPVEYYVEPELPSEHSL